MVYFLNDDVILPNLNILSLGVGLYFQRLLQDPLNKNIALPRITYINLGLYY